MRKIDKLLFGPSGIPMSIEGNTVDGINGVKKLGLNASEMLFVHSINVSEQLAKEVKKTAEQNDIVLTCHGSYYIKLNSQDKFKRQQTPRVTGPRFLINFIILKQELRLGAAF